MGKIRHHPRQNLLSIGVFKMRLAEFDLLTCQDIGAVGLGQYPSSMKRTFLSSNSLGVSKGLLISKL